MQADKADSRTYSDYESVNEAMEGTYRSLVILASNRSLVRHLSPLRTTPEADQSGHAVDHLRHLTAL